MKTSTSKAELIIRAAEDLLERIGPERMTMRAICAAAGVTAPTLYHYFGDKGHLMDELVNRGIDEFLADRRSFRETDDPLLDLKRGWDRFLAFGFEHPWLFRLMIERVMQYPEIASEMHALTRSRLVRLCNMGRLRTDVEFASKALKIATNAVIALFVQGEPKEEIRRISSFLFEAVTARLIV